MLFLQKWRESLARNERMPTNKKHIDKRIMEDVRRVRSYYIEYLVIYKITNNIYLSLLYYFCPMQVRYLKEINLDY